MDRDAAKGIAFEEPKMAERSLADAGRVLQHSIEDRLKFAGRA